MDALPRPATFWGLPKRGIALLLINALFWQPIWAQAATGIVVSNGATQVGQAGNGVPVVNIAAPNASGLSHNQYQAYNVGQEGVILNNATGNVQATQLGGIIVGNANLQGRAASTILNEVNGGSPSQLNGYTEVAGQAARVIVANPYGVTCNGCGFINTPRATLTGDISNTRSIATTEASGKGFSQRTSVVDNAARIEASNDLTLTAANDVVIAAAEKSNSSSRQDKRYMWWPAI